MGSALEFQTAQWALAAVDLLQVPNDTVRYFSPIGGPSADVPQPVTGDTVVWLPSLDWDDEWHYGTVTGTTYPVVSVRWDDGTRSTETVGTVAKAFRLIKE